jgi:hypothetical protein
MLLLDLTGAGCGFSTAPYGPGGPATSVLISAATHDPIGYVQVHDTIRLAAVPLDLGGYPVEAGEGAPRVWTLSAPALARLDPQPPSGREALMTGLLPGSLTVSAAVLGVNGTVKVTVLPPLRSVVLAPAATELAVGDSVFIQAIVTDADGHQLSGLYPEWHFGDPNVASFRDIGIAGGLRFYASKPGTYVLGVRIAHLTGDPATIQVVAATGQ